MNTEISYAIMYLEINIIAVLVVGIIRYKTMGLSRMVAQRNFAMALDSMNLFFLSDTFYVMMKCGVLPYFRGAALACKELYFLMTAVMCFFWFVYFEYMQDSPFVKNRRRVLLSSLLVWIMAILLVVNIFTGILFYIDEEGIYHRGSLFVVQYLLSYIYVFVSCTRALIGVFQKSKFMKRRMLVTLALFPVPPAIAGLIQFFHPELPLACVALSIDVLIMYLNWLDQMISIDPLTRLNNRKQLVYLYEAWQEDLQEESYLYLMIIDANKFKGINDTYGHIEGDAALVRIADALVLSCKNFHGRTNIARYGGDEFVILADVESPELVDALQVKIKKTLGEMNRAAQSPYELTVSIGMARAEKGIALKELMEKADEEMYQQKKLTQK